MRNWVFWSNGFAFELTLRAFLCKNFLTYFHTYCRMEDVGWYLF